MGSRVYPDVPRVYFDIDGVLADFDGAAAKLGITEKEYKVLPNAFKNLFPINNALESVQKIAYMGFDCWCLSKIPKENINAATEKLFWIQKYIPMLHDKVILTSDKGAVGTSRDFLIDDHPEWANASNFRGTVIRFTNNWPEVVGYLETKKPNR